jgi:hypothetical protein
MFIVALFTIAKIWNLSRFSSTVEKTVLYIHNGELFSLE